MKPASGTPAALSAELPLAHIQVLDLGGYIAGPYGATLLADLGANIIKIEPPEGDPLRRYPSTLASESRAFLGVNRGKRGMVLNLKNDRGREVLLRLAHSSDVLIHSLRPSVPARLGIAYEQLQPVNPRLVYCALSGFGENGPDSGKPGYDQVLQSLTGICAFQGRPDGPPEIVLGSVVDFYAASLIAYATAAALFRREQTGQGQYVSVSLLQAALAMQSQRMIWAESEARDVGREGRDMRSGGVTGIYATQAGYIYISANTPHFWSALCATLGLGKLAANPKYDTIRKRAQHAAEILPQVRAAFLTRTALEWEAQLGESVPCSAIRSIEEMFDHPQVLSNGLVQDFAHPKVGHYRGFANPIAWNRAPQTAPLATPTLGEHSRHILSKCGYSAADIETLVQSGALGAD